MAKWIVPPDQADTESERRVCSYLASSMSRGYEDDTLTQNWYAARSSGSPRNALSIGAQALGLD